MMIPELKAEERFNPWKKNNWLIATPKSPHKAIKGKSLRSILDRFVKLSTSQNSAVAPTTRNKMKTVGVKKPGMTPFAST